MQERKTLQSHHGHGSTLSSINIIAISPVPSLGLLLQSMSQEAVVLLQVVDLHQVAPVQLTLSPGVLPVTLNVREQVLVTCLTNKQLASMLKRPVIKIT